MIWEQETYRSKQDRQSNLKVTYAWRGFTLIHLSHSRFGGSLCSAIIYLFGLHNVCPNSDSVFILEFCFKDKYNSRFVKYFFLVWQVFLFTFFKKRISYAENTYRHSSLVSEFVLLYREYQKNAGHIKINWSVKPQTLVVSGNSWGEYRKKRT
jgi:hypothetical protein